MKITYFGTWAALNKSVDTMHMKLFDKSNELFVDTWWGMSLMQRIQNWQEHIQHLYMTHCHSDHILGIVHVLRVTKTRPLHLYCTQDLEKRIDILMNVVWKWKHYRQLKDNGNIHITYINHWTHIHIWDWILSSIDLFSPKDEQHGFTLTQWNKKLVFFGDEAIDILKRKDLDQYIWVDRLLCEAFCKDDDKELRKPHEKQHITASDAWRIATALQAKNLIISHIDDYTSDRKWQLKEIYVDASKTFSWNIVVPHDNDTLDLW